MAVMWLVTLKVRKACEACYFWGECVGAQGTDVVRKQAVNGESRAKRDWRPPKAFR